MSSIGTGDKLGRYQLDRLIASGGFGDVYTAHSHGPGGFNRTVAVKIFSRERPEGIEAFFREARVAALLQHRNIVQVFEVDCEGDTHYLVMEYVDGLSLHEFMAAVGVECPVWLLVGVGVEVCRGLVYAHELRTSECPAGIMHRDVKPSNVLLSTLGDVKLTDFGLAKRHSAPVDQLTVEGMVKGTPGFMSPEQESGSAQTTATDVFALGLLLSQTLAAGRQSAPDSLLAPLNEVLGRAMHPLATHRPEARELLHELEQALEATAPPGGLPKLAEALGTWVKRAKAASRPRDADIAHDSTHLMQGAAPGGFTPEIASSPKAVATRPRQRTARWVARCVVITGLIGLAVALGYLASGLLSYDPGGGATLAADAADAPQTASSATEDAWARRDLAEARAPDASADRGLDLNVSPQVDSGGARRPPDRGRKQPPGKQRKRRPQIVAGELGRLSVDSDPWSSVYLDGKRLGTTPLWLVSVPAGRHRLRLVTSHGRSTERWLLVPQGGSLNLGTIDLRARQP